jgi:hypothetical protein
MSNGYIQIDIGGKLRGLKFGMLAVEGIVEEAARYKGDKGNISGTKTAYDLVYYGLLNNCEVKKIDPDFTYEDVTDWVEELTMTEDGKGSLQQVSKTFIESRALQIMNAKAEEVLEEAKKNIQAI